MKNKLANLKDLSKKSYVLIGFGLLFLVLALWFLFAMMEKHMHRGELTLYGNVDIRQVDLGFRVSGKLSQMKLEEGDEVKKGDLLATLDEAPYEAALSAAKAQLQEAEANYAKLKRGNRPQEIEEARANVRDAEASRTNADLIFKRQSEQIKDGSTSQQAYDNATAQKTQAEALLKSAKEALSLAEEGFRKEDIEAGKAAMETAKAQLQSANINLEDTQLLSPSDGIIFTRVVEPGAILAPQSIVYTVSLHKPVWVRAYASEPNLGFIKPGMKALVYTDTFPNKPFEGQIGFISPQAEFTPKTVETPELRTDLVYRLRVWVEDPESRLRQGMPVTVKIKFSE